MSSFRGDFEHFYPLSEDEVEKAIRSGLVTPDTNVLLALYRFQGKARDQLFGALEKLKDRLWIPHQVGLEFHRNRLDVIEEQVNYLKSTQKDLDRLSKDLRDVTGKFAARIGLDQERVQGMSTAISELQKLLRSEVIAAQQANKVRLSNHDSDPVLEQLEVMLDNRVGERMKSKALKAARKEARRRVDEQIPPGFEDARKADPTGDYLVFRELMVEARIRKLPVVFVTDDEKRDWYRRKGDLVLGARHELRDEIMTKAGVQFVIMTTADFLLKAQNYLGVEVSPETVDQAKELPSIVQKEDHPKKFMVPSSLPKGWAGRIVIPSSLPEGWASRIVIPSSLPEDWAGRIVIPSSLPENWATDFIAPRILPDGWVSSFAFPTTLPDEGVSAEPADDEDESHRVDDENDDHENNDSQG